MRKHSDVFPALKSIVREAIILAYKEDTSRLENAFRAEGLHPRVLRPSYSEQELNYSRTIRCLLNHGEAWRLSGMSEGYTLIVEADFVPCVGFGKLSLPFDPDARGAKAWAFLYTGGQRVLKRYEDGSLQGHAACPVAYVVSKTVGNLLCEYLKEELIRHKDLQQYSLWDTNFQWHLMGKGAACFMPWRQFGEHGGIPNPEHKSAGIGLSHRIPWLRHIGMAGNHHADVLAARLSFLPAYAKGSRLRFIKTRIEAKLIGFLKLCSGKMVMPPPPTPVLERVRLFLICLRRLASPY